MSSIPHTKFDRDNDSNWFPFDYTSDAEDDSPPDIDIPDIIVNAVNIPIDDIDTMPIAENNPTKADIKQAKAEAAQEKKDAVKQMKEDKELDEAIRRMNQSMYNSVAEESAPAPMRKAPAAKNARKTKSHAPIGKEEIEKHQSLLMQLDRYRLSPRFQDIIHSSGLRLSGVEDHSIIELEELLTRVRTVVGNRNNSGGSFLGSGILMGVSAVENMPIVNHYADIHGLSNMLSANPEFLDLCEQLAIDYSIMATLSPEKRLLILIGKSGIQMHGINRAKYAMAMAAAAAEQRVAQSSQNQQSAPNVVQNTQSTPVIVQTSIGEDIRRY